MFKVGRVTYCTHADSGTLSMLASKKVTKAGSKVGNSQAVKWSTQVGGFETSKCYRLKKAVLLQFTSNMTFGCTVHQFEKKESDLYNIILGKDVMDQLGLDL